MRNVEKRSITHFPYQSNLIDINQTYHGTETKLEIRRIKGNERLLARRLHQYVFTEWSDKEVKDDDLAYILPDETYGLFENEKLVSTVIFIAFKQSIRGVIKSMGGISAVGSYPEARHRGYIRELMKTGFKAMLEKNQSVSMLMPFKETFYERFGYTKANSPYLIQVPMKGFHYTLDDKANDDWEINRFPAIDVKDEFLNFVQEVGPRQYHGFVFFENVPDSLWKSRTKDSIIVLLKRNKEIQSAARYRFKKTEKPGEYFAEMTVIELYWRDLTARKKLFNFFAKHEDQINQVSIHAPFDLGVEHWFQNVEAKVIREAPWMVRVVDVIEGVRDLPASGEDILTVEIKDDLCDWNNGIFSIHSEDNRLQATQSSGKPIVQLSINALTALVYGTQPLEELEFKGEVTINESWARHVLQRWFPVVPLYNNVYF